MRVRHKTTGRLGDARDFNIHSVAPQEIIVGFDDGDQTSDYMRDYDVQLKDGRWMSFEDAFTLHLLITDNYNSHFFEPQTEADRVRGYTL